MERIVGWIIVICIFSIFFVRRVLVVEKERISRLLAEKLGVARISDIAFSLLAVLVATVAISAAEYKYGDYQIEAFMVAMVITTFGIILDVGRQNGWWADLLDWLSTASAEYCQDCDAAMKMDGAWGEPSDQIFLGHYKIGKLTCPKCGAIRSKFMPESIGL